MKRSAATHPRWHAGLNRPVSLEDQVRHCRATRSISPAAWGDGAAGPHASRPHPDDTAALALTAALVASGAGGVITPDRHPALDPWVRQGQAIWHQRLGQLNLSCAQCHDQRAGLRLGGTRIPQGHDSGYPLYRMEWQSLGPLERRLRGCMTGIRAEPFAPGADEWRALAVYMHRRSAGLRIEAGAVRP